MTLMGGLHHVPRVVLDAYSMAELVCKARAEYAGCDVSTFHLEQLVAQTVDGMLLEGDDTPFPTADWHTFRWTAEKHAASPYGLVHS